jgi:hypothetical protein
MIMPVPPELLLTPNPTLALRSDGYLVAIAPGALPPRKASDAEMQEAAELAFARGLQIMSTGETGGAAALLNSLSPQLRAIVATVSTVISIVVPVVAFVTAAIAALELLGLTGSKYEPIFERIEELNRKLDRILAELSGTQKLVYGTWAAAHWRDIANLLGDVSAALDTVREVQSLREDVTSPGVIHKLAIADNQSRTAVARLVAAGIDGGYWMRPHFADALNMAAWEFKTDDRPDVTGDGRVWDYRIALPTLLIAITARVMVVKTMYPAADAHKRLCPEVRTWSRFFGALIQRLQNNVRRKTAFATPETQDHCDGVHTTAFYAGAVDLSVGLDDFIHLDPYGINTFAAYQQKRGVTPYQPGPSDGPHRCWGSPVNPSDFSDLITEQDALASRSRFDHTAVLEKQGIFAANRLLWKSPILNLCDISGQLWKLCPDPPTLVGQVSSQFGKKRAIAAAVATGDGSGKRSAQHAFALADVIQGEADTSEETLRTGAALATLMIDEKAGAAFRQSLRTFVRSRLDAKEIRPRPPRTPSAGRGTDRARKTK